MKTRMLKTLKTNIEDNGKRFDNYVIKILKNVPKSMIYKLIRKGVIRINGKKAKVSDRIWENDIVKIPVELLKSKSDGKAPSWLKNLLQQAIIHEDNNLIVIDKPFGVPSHGGSKLKFGVIETIRQIKREEKRIDLVHRLDRATSGCLVLAKNHLILKEVHNIWNSDKVSKIYTALVSGAVPTNLTTIRSNLKTERYNKIQKSDWSDGATGKLSETVILSNRPISGHYTLLKLSLKTGRMHQIRAQFSHIGHPLLCDEIYGDSHLNERCKELGLSRMFLHCSSLRLEIGKYRLFVESQLPNELHKFLNTNKTYTYKGALVR